MVNLMRAEWDKQFKNYKMTAFLVWIFPIGTIATLGLGLIVSLIMGDVVDGLPVGPGDWRNNLLGAWGIITAFPANIIARLLPLAFMAVVFAGEYEWGTWKNLVPRNRRSSLVVVKLVIPTLLVMISLSLTSLLLGLGSVGSHWISGEPLGPAVSGEILIEFLGDYGREVGLALASLLILGGVAAIGAFLTRSILGALLVSFGFSLIDLIGLGLLGALAFIFKIPQLINLLSITPNYSLDNIRSWLILGEASRGFNPAFTVEPSLAFSVVCLLAWLVGLIGLAVWLFKRQDITG
jgi:MFS family permease